MLRAHCAPTSNVKNRQKLGDAKNENLQIRNNMYSLRMFVMKKEEKSLFSESLILIIVSNLSVNINLRLFNFHNSRSDITN